ncbi:hypothetical protein CXB49_07195 [Chromobacterium sp. ATCC 53434]|uniref:hypothetical protein n=1 Tax=Chromobacterium sp. (strain ATCC 53434 / SC 14030) TaxID=2059672 RepID=UPI000C76F970|nr:hypothetical protein [Chromobacterium sp. ATCC 53434]AUH50604.1 hypothetical protein CXB49_07195 [Chromobacterium sp. ATCC 53434]
MNHHIDLDVNAPLRLEYAKDLPLRVIRRQEGFWFVAAELAAALKQDVDALLPTQEAPAGRLLLLAGETEPALCLSEGELDELVRRVKTPGARRLRRWWREETRPVLLHAGGPATTAESLHLALALAAEAAQQVSRAVMEAVLRGPGPWQHSRWVVALDYERRNRQRWPHGKLIGLSSTVATLEGLAELIAEPGRMPVNNADLVKLAAACHLRLAERMGRIAG